MLGSLCDFNSLFVNGNIFSFLNRIILVACSFKDSQNFFIQSFPRYKVCLFLICLNPKIVGIEYAQGICSPIFIAEDFSGLFAHPSNF